MKKTILVFTVSILILTSCAGEPSQADYDSEAASICGCMNEKLLEDGAVEYMVEMTELDFSLCASLVESNIDITDEKMKIGIYNSCPKLAGIHDEYVKDIKGQ